jgi:hypothetical protein
MRRFACAEGGGDRCHGAALDGNFALTVGGVAADRMRRGRRRFLDANCGLKMGFEVDCWADSGVAGGLG